MRKPPDVEMAVRAGRDGRSSGSKTAICQPNEPQRGRTAISTPTNGHLNARLVLVGPVDDRAAERLEREVERDDGGGGGGVDAESVRVDSVHDEEVAVWLVVRRGSGAHESRLTAVVAHVEGPTRQVA